MYTSRVGAFNSAQEKWENYEIWFEAWLMVNEVEARLHKHALLAEVGPQTFAILK